ncbi:MAG: SDH family Clp fold serine proteinase [Thermacetogeniaceae bacterium]
MKFSVFDIFWILLLLISFWPMFKQRSVEAQRLKIIRTIEKQRGSRVITLIHRQELFNILGFPITRYINIEDSEHVLRAIRLTPEDMPIDIVLHTPGGLVLASEQIALALKRHPAKVTVFIPHYAMSGGTLIALAADEIVMDENAVAGPVDPQLGEYPAVSILKAVSRKNVNEIDDRTLIMADVAEKAIRQVKDFVFELLKEKMSDEDTVHRVVETLTSGKWTHDYPLTCEQLRKLGIPISCNLPKEIHQLMELYPQPVQRRPSVQYIPIPYGTNRKER